MAQDGSEKNVRKDFSKIVSDIGIAIAFAADAYRKSYNQSVTFGEACGLVIGMALDAYSDHDNSADMLQAANMLKAYTQAGKPTQAKKTMIQ